MMHLPDLSSASLRFALGLRSLLDLHQTDEQLSSADSLAQAKNCAKNCCANALGSTADVVETPSWDEEAPEQLESPLPCRRSRRPTLRRLGLLVDLLCAASTEEHMVLLTVLLERVLCASEGRLLSRLNWQPLLLCCFLLTSKELDDDPVSFRDLRMLAAMHDLRSAAGGYSVHGRFTVATHGESFSSYYNEDIEDIELALLQLLQWSTFCSASNFGHHRQRVIDRSVEVMAEPDDGSPGSSVLCQADWEYMHERLHACRMPIVTEPVLSSPGLGCRSMLDAEDLSADREEKVPSLASDEEDTHAFIEPGLPPSSAARAFSRGGNGVRVPASERVCWCV